MKPNVPFALASTACLALAAAAVAEPATAPGAKTAPRGHATLGPHIDSIFSDNFDSYPSGSGLVGQGGWEFWGPGAFDATVDSGNANSAPNSALAVNETDVVQLFNITEGKWQLRVQTWTPAGAAGEGFVIMLNTFVLPSGGPFANWSLQVRFNPSTGTVLSDFGGQTLPLITNQWVELVADIDLDNDLLDIFYGGQPLATGLIWTQNVSGNGKLAIECLDLYSQMVGFRWDDVSLQQESACYPDCDGNGQLNIDDFICFQLAFALQNPYADCDGNQIFNIDDFICFQLAFALGC